MSLPFSQAALVWARTKPADEAYDYGDGTRCAFGQFLRETGRGTNPIAGFNYWLDGDVRHPLSDRDADAARLLPRTFGAFADRLEALS